MRKSSIKHLLSISIALALVACASIQSPKINNRLTEQQNWNEQAELEADRYALHDYLFLGVTLFSTFTPPDNATKTIHSPSWISYTFYTPQETLKRKTVSVNANGVVIGVAGYAPFPTREAGATFCQELFSALKPKFPHLVAYENGSYGVNFVSKDRFIEHYISHRRMARFVDANEKSWRAYEKIDNIQFDPNLSSLVLGVGQDAGLWLVGMSVESMDLTRAKAEKEQLKRSNLQNEMFGNKISK